MHYFFFNVALILRRPRALRRRDCLLRIAINLPDPLVLSKCLQKQGCPSAIYEPVVQILRSK
jgi:hypothetical protein